MHLAVVLHFVTWHNYQYFKAKIVLDLSSDKGGWLNRSYPSGHNILGAVSGGFLTSVIFYLNFVSSNNQAYSSVRNVVIFVSQIQ